MTPPPPQQEDDLPKLPLHGTTALASPAAGAHLACNPAIDLVATAADGNSAVHVSRAGDKGGAGLVWKYAERGASARGVVVEGVRWRGDGECLAVAWSDGMVRVLGLEGGKPVHHIRISEGGEGGKVEFLAWARNFTGESRRRRKQAGKTGREERRMMLDGERSGDLAADLPRELTFLEVDTALPKLPPLAASGTSGDDSYLFSSAASINSVFRACKAEDSDDVHVIVVGTADGRIHLSLYDALIIGALEHSSPGEGVLQLCGHSSHPDTPTHMLLLRSQAGDGTALQLVPMHLGFLNHSPVDLSLLASKTTVLQNLMRYLRLTHSHMISEWQATRELPGRYMASVQEDLKKQPNGQLTIAQALYHTVVTGHVFPAVQEWLVDTIGDRGHKRWERAVVAGLTGLRSLVHENFIPALERCGVVLSRLLGIARFHGPEDAIGFDEAQINRLLDIVSCLMVVAHKVLLTVMDELEHFHSFSLWFKLEIDKQGSSSSEELTEKEAMMDYPKVLLYIQHDLESSPLALYFDDVAKEDYVKDQELLEPGLSLIDLLDKQLQEQEAGRPYMKMLPRVDFLLKYLNSRAGGVFKGISEAQKQRVKFGQTTEISVGKKIWKHGIRMSQPRKKDTLLRTFTAIVREDDRSKIFIFQSLVPLNNCVSGAHSTKACGLGLPEGVVIVDFAFLDDKSLLVLCSQREEPRSVLLRIAYQSAHMPYQEYAEGQSPSVMEFDGTGSEGVSACFAFVHMSGFTPIQMEAQGASTLRGEMPARVCLLGRDRAVFKTYTLPENWDESG